MSGALLIFHFIFFNQKKMTVSFSHSVFSVIPVPVCAVLSASSSPPREVAGRGASVAGCVLSMGVSSSPPQLQRARQAMSRSKKIPHRIGPDAAGARLLMFNSSLWQVTQRLTPWLISLPLFAMGVVVTAWYSICYCILYVFYVLVLCIFCIFCSAKLEKIVEKIINH